MQEIKDTFRYGPSYERGLLQSALTPKARVNESEFLWTLVMVRETRIRELRAGRKTQEEVVSSGFQNVPTFPVLLFV